MSGREVTVQGWAMVSLWWPVAGTWSGDGRVLAGHGLTIQG
ncbi:hypothetical protein [Streptosporangium sp. KLBMP 9127]